MKRTLQHCITHYITLHVGCCPKPLSQGSTMTICDAARDDYATSQMVSKTVEPRHGQ